MSHVTATLAAPGGGFWASPGTYPDHVFDDPPGDNRVLLDQLRQVVQPGRCGRNARSAPPWGPRSARAGGAMGLGGPPAPQLSGAAAGPRGHPETPNPGASTKAWGAPPGLPQILCLPWDLRGLGGTHGTPHNGWDTHMAPPKSGAPTGPQGLGGHPWATPNRWATPRAPPSSGAPAAPSPPNSRAPTGPQEPDGHPHGSPKLWKKEPGRSGHPGEPPTCLRYP